MLWFLETVGWVLARCPPTREYFLAACSAAIYRIWWNLSTAMEIDSAHRLSYHSTDNCDSQRSKSPPGSTDTVSFYANFRDRLILIS